MNPFQEYAQSGSEGQNLMLVVSCIILLKLVRSFWTHEFYKAPLQSTPHGQVQIKVERLPKVWIS